MASLRWSKKQLEEYTRRSGKPVEQGQPVKQENAYAPYRSQTEKDFAESGWRDVELALMHKYGKVVAVYYEKYVLMLPGNRYKPDFSIHFERARVFAEIKHKSSKKLVSYRDSRAKLRLAAAIIPTDRFIQVTRVGSEWIVEEID